MNLNLHFVSFLLSEFGFNIQGLALEKFSCVLLDKLQILYTAFFLSRVVGPRHFNADPDPAFLSNADPDPAFHSNADPDTA